MGEQTVIYMNQLMRGVVTNGTGRNAQIPGVPAVGKTGTTSPFRDAWFCGYTGNYVAAVWYGNDDYSPTNKMQGAPHAGDDLAEIHGLCAHQYRGQAGPGIDFEPAPFVRSADTGAGAGRAPSPRCSRRRRTSSSISPMPARRRSGAKPAQQARARSRPRSRRAFDPCGSLTSVPQHVGGGAGGRLRAVLLRAHRRPPVRRAEVGPWAAWPAAGAPRPIPTREALSGAHRRAAARPGRRHPVHRHRRQRRPPARPATAVTASTAPPPTATFWTLVPAGGRPMAAHRPARRADWF